ncbi:preprotein translocase subunit SecG [Candidatus Wirthbacteria bacterium CG2_30_54_11]|uniref:Protein-export membrane protein SecG n=1 Tax=Candidatus Wirthbacteria bacterium CG2_30_54_11 TaxID=1817892 RepID=A0A1J5IFA9_9BACT|nr:MAG: preprotein translocase subunit SecG [Candidatus Wirthbacteria bacterium CG2_30_54_11]
MDWLLQRTTLFIVQAVFGILAVILVLLQAKGVGLSGAFGGEGSFYRSRRGAEKAVYNFTIVSTGIFLVVSFLSIYAR